MSRWADLTRALAEARELGAEFRIVGHTVQRSGELPDDLAAKLDSLVDLMPAYLDVNAVDRAALTFFDTLGVEAVLVDTVEGCLPVIAVLDADIASCGGPMALDTETAARPLQAAPKPAVRLNRDGTVAARQAKVTDDGAALSVHRGFVCLLQLYAGGTKVFLFKGEALRAMVRSRWLRCQDVVTHNAKFDALWLRVTRQKLNTPALPDGQKAGTWDCTLQAAGLVVGTGFGGESRKLEKVAEKLLGVSPPKELATSDWSLPLITPGQIAYAATDAVLAWRLWRTMQPTLDRTPHGSNSGQSRRGAYELQLHCGPAVGAMEERGVGVNREEFTRQLEGWTADVCKARAAYTEATGEAPPTSQAELIAWLKKILTPEQERTWPRTKVTKELVTSYTALSILHAEPAARAVLQILQNSKLVKSFGEKFLARLNPVTGRFHSSFNIGAAKTGRFSCSEPNLQQLPSKRAPEFRKCIVANDGYVLVGGDYAQIEVRAAAWISEDAELTDLLLSGLDVHRSVASTISGIPYDDVTKELRGYAKPITFGALFGMGAITMAAYASEAYGVAMTVAEAKEALDKFLGRFSGFRRWRYNHAKLCQARGFIEVPTSGRILDVAWDARKEPKIDFTLATNMPIQGSCADCMMLALRLVHERLAGYRICDDRGGLICTIHDEIILEVLEDLADIARAVLQGAMLDAFTTTFPGAPTNGLVDAKVGKSWFDIK